MCLIVHKAADKEIPKWVLQSAYKANNDGWGMMALNDDGIPFTVKGVGEVVVGAGFDEFYNEYMLKFAHRECAIHFRMRTSGAVDVDNAHPYEVGDHVYVMHNGVIKVNEYNKEKSDTWHFARLIEEQVQNGWLRNSSFKGLAEMAIGYGNKLVFLDKEGFVFYNKHQGDYFFDGCWFSNTYSWDAPGKYNWHWDDEGYGYSGQRFPGQTYPVTKYRESYASSATGATERAIYLADGTKIVLGATSKDSTENLEETKESIIEEIQTTLEGEEFANLSQEDQAAFFKAAEARMESIDSKMDRMAHDLTQTQIQTASTALALSGITSLKEEDEIILERACVPQTFKEWASLSINEIKELTYEEPDMIAESFFDALHLVKE